MPHLTSHQPGSFCWIELATNDADGARAFYTSLFAWDVNEVPMGEQGTYYLFRKDGRDAAAMYQADPSQGTPPNWMSYIAVADADKSAAQAQSLGATVFAEPFDVFDLGRMSVLSDPQGAVFALWQAKSNIGVQIRDEANTLCWNELQARDLDAAKKFYPALFGWRMKESEEYTEWHLGENAVGGMLASKAPAEVPSYWMPYFAVDDCGATVKKAEAGGATTVVPPMDIPNVGTFAVMFDPQGAVFAVIKLTL